MNTKHLFLLLICLFTLVDTQSQNTITGFVVSKTLKGIPNSTIRLLERDSVLIAGTVSGENGQFKININRAGRFSIEFSCIGYTSRRLDLQTSKDQAINLGYIPLDTAAVELQTVQITANRYVRKAEKTLVFPDKKQIKYASNGYDLLSNLMIPSLEVNRIDKKVSTLAGDATLYINGNKATPQEIQALRPKDIAFVEYHDFPQGKYAKDVVAINYVTKVYQSGGYVMASAEQRIGYLYGSYQVAAKYNKKSSTYTFIAGYDLEQDKSTEAQQERMSLEEGTLNRLLQLETKKNSNMQYAMFTWDTWKKKSNWLLSVGYVRREMPDGKQHETIGYQEWEKSISTKNLTEETAHQPYISGRYYYPINKKQWLMLEAGLTYTQNKYNRDYTEEGNRQEDDYKYSLRVDEDVYRLAGNLYYNISFNRNNYFMLDLAHFQYLTSDAYMGNVQNSMKLSSGETQLRLIYGQNFGKKFSLRATLGGSLNVYSLKHESHQKSFSPRPSLSLQYRPNSRHSLRLSGYMGNSTPQLSMLNELEQPVDQIIVKKGNSNLDITKYLGGDIDYTFLSNRFSLSAALMYTAMLDPVKNYYYTDKNKLIQTFITDGEFHQIEPKLSASLNLFNNSLNLKAHAGYLYTTTTGLYASSKYAWKGGGSISYSIRNWYLQTFYSSPVKAVNSICHYHIPADYGLSISYFIKAWSMEVGTRRPFSNSKEKISFPGNGTYSYHRFESGNALKPMVYFKLSYNFDFGKKLQKNNNHVNKQINTAIFK